jgi:hypothetical protein
MAGLHGCNWGVVALACTAIEQQSRVHMACVPSDSSAFEAPGMAATCVLLVLEQLDSQSRGRWSELFAAKVRFSGFDFTMSCIPVKSVCGAIFSSKGVA